MEKQKNIYDNIDEVDFKDILGVLFRRKKITVFILFLSILLAVLYITFSTPLYQGKAILEIGKVVNLINEVHDDKNIVLANTLELDDVKNLNLIVNTTTDARANVPKGTKLLEIIARGKSQADALKKTQEVIDLIIKRHEEIAKFYMDNSIKVRMTKLVGEIKVSDAPVLPNKMLIFIFSLFLGVMLLIMTVLFLEFLQVYKEKR